MNRVNTLVLCEEDYASKEEWEDKIKKAIMVIANARCIMTAVLEEIGIFRIDFNPSEERYGCDYPHWLAPEEYESIFFNEGEE